MMIRIRTSPAATAQRSGILMLELTVAMMLLGVVISLLGQGISVVRKQQELTEFQVLARIELSNLERTASTELQSWKLSPDFQRRFPDASLSTVSVTNIPSDLPLSRSVEATISRTSPHGILQSVRLVLWPQDSGGDQ